jgi:hypothetical protein
MHILGKMCQHDSVINCYRMDNHDTIPGNDWDIFLHCHIQTHSRGPPASYKLGTGEVSVRGYSGQSLKLIILQQFWTKVTTAHRTARC